MASDSVAEVEIPIWVKGTQKWVTGLTKRTTCDDVIYALMYQEGLHENVNTSAYAIFEKWREVERPLQGRTKIVKVWRTWGAEQGNVHLSMRRIDELEYSGEFSLTRRKKRSRHKLRERERDRERERERRSRDHRHHHHHYCQNASERLRSMETLVKLVISQERKLKDMIEQADDTDKLIDRYESRLYTKTLDTYTDGENGDAMDEFFSNANIDELEMYVNYCDKIIALEDRIKNEHSKIEELAYQMQCCAKDSGLESEPSTKQDDLAKVQSDLNRAVSCAIMQQYKFQDLQRELQFYDEKLNEKSEMCRILQQEINEADDSHVVSNESLNSAASVSSAQSDSGESNGSSIENPLPLPERSNRVQKSKPPPVPERARAKPDVPKDSRGHYFPNQNAQHINETVTRNAPPKEHIPERKPILKSSASDSRNGYNMPFKQSSSGETKVRFKTDTLIDKYNWEESSLSEGISIDQSDCSDSKDLFDYVPRANDYSHIKSGVADKPYLTVKVEDNDSNSDTGLSSMHSDDSAVYHLETLV